MVVYVKFLDSKYLLMIGLEGFYKKSGKGIFMVNLYYMFGLGMDFIENYEVDGIDFVIVYVYFDFWYYFYYSIFSKEELFIFR